MLRLVLPKGSLERATLDLFAAADLSVSRSSNVDYRATIDDERVAEVRSCVLRRYPCTSRTGCSISGSPGATGSRSGAAR